MNLLSSRTFAAAVAIVAVFGAWTAARAAEGCAEKIIRARAAETPGMTVDKFQKVETGLLMTAARKGEEGLVMVGMTVVGVDLVTFQSVFGRDGVSTVSDEDAKWLNQLFEKLYPDAVFRACPDVLRQEKPTPEVVFAAMQTWWKQQNQKDDKYRGGNQWMVILVGAVALVLIIALATVAVIRRRRRAVAKSAGDAAASIDDGTPAPATAVESQMEPSSANDQGAPASDENQEVL